MSSGSGTGTIVVSTGSPVSLLRQKLVEDTGDYGLVQTIGEDVWADNGANRLLNKGIKWLGTHLKSPTDYVQISATLAAASNSLAISGIRGLTKAIVTDEDGHRYRVLITTPDQIRILENADVDTGTTGRPLFICRDIRPISATTTDAFTVWPTSDKAYTLEVEGSFYATSLVNDADVTWWTATEERQELVLGAAAMVRERDQMQNPRRAGEMALALIDELEIIDNTRIFVEEQAGTSREWVIRG